MLRKGLLESCHNLFSIWLLESLLYNLIRENTNRMEQEIITPSLILQIAEKKIQFSCPHVVVEYYLIFTQISPDLLSPPHRPCVILASTV